MRKLLSVFCVLSLMFALLSSTSCSEKEKGLSFLRANYSPGTYFSEGELGYKDSETAYEIVADDYTSASLDFEYGCANSGELYEISCYVNVDNYSTQNSYGKNVVIYSKSNEDINSEIIYSNSINGDTEYMENNNEGWVKLKKVVRADSSGFIDFSVVLGWENNKSKGNFLVDRVQVVPISKIDTYKCLKSDDDSIEMVFFTSDIKKYCTNESSLHSYINVISDLRKDFTNLIGDDFTEGKSIFLFTETQDQFGYAGIPIYISRKNAKDVLSSINNFDSKNCNEYTYGVLHEMSHTFDRICGNETDKIWLFDSEFWADFKIACILEKNHISINDNRVSDYFKENDYLDNGIYTSEGLVFNLLKIINEDFEKNYQALSSTLNSFQELNAELVCKNNYEKFSMFKRNFKKYSDINIQDDFSKKQWKTVKNYLETD